MHDHARRSSFITLLRSPWLMVTLIILVLLSLGFNLFLTYRLSQISQMLKSQAVALVSQLQQAKDQNFEVTIPIKQNVPIRAQIPIAQQITVPIDTEVKIDQDITLPIETPLGVYHYTLPLHTSVPVKVDIPVAINQTVPVSTSVALDLSVPVKIPLSDTVIGKYLAQLEMALNNLIKEL